jgi:hypothetical protein
MTKNEALKLALIIEEFDGNDESLPLELLKPIAETLRALAQPVQELEYCMDYHCAGDCGQPHNQKEMQTFLVAQPAQEPVAWEWRYDSCGHAVVNRLVVTETPEPTLFLKNVFARGPFPLYTAPQQRTWVGLTEDERSELVTLHHKWNEYGQAIEAKLKEKNT